MMWVMSPKEEKSEITANSVHPGLIATNLFRHYSILPGNVFPTSKVKVSMFDSLASLLESHDRLGFLYFI